MVGGKMMTSIGVWILLMSMNHVKRRDTINIIIVRWKQSDH